MLPPSFASWLTPTVRPKLGKQAVNEAIAEFHQACEGGDAPTFAVERSQYVLTARISKRGAVHGVAETVASRCFWLTVLHVGKSRI